MEKDIGRIPKNQETEIVVRIDDFGGRKGLTIREFVKSPKYTGFTKAGVRISADKFADFKHMINSVLEEDLKEDLKEDSGSKESTNIVSDRKDYEDYGSEDLL